MSTKEKLKEVLELVNDHYKRRSQSDVETLETRLFGASEVKIIIGTCNNEWCFGTEHVQNILSTDWSGWGNLNIDIPTTIMGESGPFTWFHAKASLEYAYNNQGEFFKASLDNMKDAMSSREPVHSREQEVLSLLRRIADVQKNEGQSVSWSLTVSGILEEVDGQLQFRLMQFSVPTETHQADVRLDLNQGYLGVFQKECYKIAEVNLRERDNHRKENLQRNKSLSQAFIEGTFTLVEDDQYRYLGTDGKARIGADFRKYYDQLTTAPCFVSIDSSHIFSTISEDVVLFCGAGTLNIAEEPDDRSEPFRIEGLARIEGENQVAIEYMQISYPFNSQWDANWCRNLKK